MIKIKLIIFSILILPVVANAQENSSFVTKLKFDGANEVYPQKIVKMKNGNYLVLSNYYYPGPGGGDSFTEISDEGEKIGDFKFPMNDYFYCNVSSFYYFENGDIFFNGWGDKSHIFETGFNFMYDQNEDLKWSRDDFSIHSRFTTFFSPFDSSFIGRSCYTKYDTLKQEYKNQYGFCIKLDYNGRIVWQIDSLVFYDSILKNTLTYHLFEYISVFDSFNYFLLDRGENYRRMLQMTPNGDIIKNDTFSFTFNPKDFTISLYKLNDGYLFYLSKWIDDDERLLVKMDEDLNTIWQYHFPLDHTTHISDLIMDDVKNIHLLVRHQDSSNDSMEFYFEILKLSSDGELLDNKIYYSVYYTYIDDLYSNSLLLLEDGSYLISASLGYGWGLGYVIKTDSNGFVDHDKIKCVSIKNEVHKNRNAKIYPNPCTTNCTFKLPINTKQKATLNLYSITGKLIRQEQFTGNSYEFFRGDLSSGLYLYKIISGKNVFTGKLIVRD
ncbi:MAG: T9SS type A sorting domain-containing protein [Bacteroidota bacterium]|nr:T9SS type A sorting domain-containing protein [Bacteroidota bacterium]